MISPSHDGPRQPLLLLSPFAKVNFVGHQVTDQSSALRFIEGNWGLGRLPGSFDQKAGSLLQMFDFNRFSPAKLILVPSTGRVISNVKSTTLKRQAASFGSRWFDPLKNQLFFGLRFVCRVFVFSLGEGPGSPSSHCSFGLSR